MFLTDAEFEKSEQADRIRLHRMSSPRECNQKL